MIQILIELYADIGRSAASIALRLARVEQDRETKRDRLALRDVAMAFDGFAAGELGERAYPLFTVDGWYVLVKVLRESSEPFRGKSAKERAAAIAVMLRCREDAGCLRRLFREVHDLAEEITVLGLTANPVTEVYNALAKEVKK